MASRTTDDTRYTFQGLHAERQARLAWSSSAFQGFQAGAFQPFGAGARSGVRPSTMGPGVFDAGWTARALAQLDRIDEEAAEESYPPINDEAKRRARRLLFAVGGCPIEPAVYPSMDGEIAIWFKSPVAAAALLILVNNEGGAGCYSSIHGESRRKRYDDSSRLPDDFLKEHLRALKGSALSQIPAEIVSPFAMNHEREVVRYSPIYEEHRRERYEDPSNLPDRLADARFAGSGRACSLAGP